jgi:hypothetical protein
MPGPNWSRPLPRPLVIPKVMTLKTLADVGVLMRHLPEHHRNKSTWRYVSAQLEQAWLTEGFDTLDLKEAKALLDELHI